MSKDEIIVEQSKCTEFEKQNGDLTRQLAKKTDLLRLECILNDQAWTCVQTLKRKAARPSLMEEQLHRDMMVLSHSIHGLHRQMTETKYLVMGCKTVKTPLVECFVFPCLHTHKEPMINQMEKNRRILYRSTHTSDFEVRVLVL